MARKRPKNISFFVSEEEYNALQIKLKSSKMKQSDFIRLSVMDKQIINVEGIQELTVELKRIGNNINQLTRLAHEGKINGAYEIVEAQKELKEIWQLLNCLIQKAR